MGAAVQKPVRILIILFVVSLVARLLFGILFVGLDTPPEGDAGTYDQIAHNMITEGKYIQYHGQGVWLSFRPPLLPLILAGLYSIVGYSFTASRLLMIVIGSLVPLLVFALADRIFGRKAALVAGGISAVWPEFILYSNTLHTETPLVLLALLQLIFLARFADGRRTRDICAAGIVAGLGCLCRPTIFAFVLVAVVWLFIITRRDLRLALRAAAIYVILTALVIAPWTYRNYRVHGRLVPITSRSGTTLWLGNNKDATGNIGDDYDKLRRMLPDAGTDDEVEASSYHRQEALRFIRANPVRFVAFGIKKTIHFWRPVGFRFPGMVDRISARTRIAVGFLPYIPIFLLFLVGLLILLKQLKLFRDQRLLLLFLIIIVYTLAHAVYTAMPRYRQPIEPITIIIGSWALVVILEAWRKRRQIQAAG
jgi:4-amino-4-deoxy-L-arabinose transferase-like glycosyltransferase